MDVQRDETDPCEEDPTSEECLDQLREEARRVEMYFRSLVVTQGWDFAYSWLDGWTSQQDYRGLLVRMLRTEPGEEFQWAADAYAAWTGIVAFVTYSYAGTLGYYDKDDSAVFLATDVALGDMLMAAHHEAIHFHYNVKGLKAWAYSAVAYKQLTRPAPEFRELLRQYYPRH
jgi:hypothetical protein